ncbi:MAG TPA: glycosyltransferase family 39 protein, partial [Isosphaeraceae bacterium]|nr:glycosyltransferase family 39 protein [Isosphaeraceae bacterium]
MGGLTLGPLEIVSWLAGWTKHDFVVPIDTMPPFSYWIGWLWSKVFGLGEVQLRWLGVTCVGLATFLIFQTARKAWGLAAGVAAGLLFALSPNVIVVAVAIRAYPLFLLASAATFLCLTRLLADPVEDRPGWLIGMAVCGIVASYTHFFGLVAIGSCLLATLILVPSLGGRIGPVLMAIAVVGLVSLGITPFVFASIKIYSNCGGTAAVPSVVAKAHGLATTLCRLFSSPVMLISPIALAASFLGVALAGASSLVPKRRSSTASTGLMLA